MALSEKTISKHNLKRAEVFAAHGLGDHDVAFAHPEFAGHMAGGDQNCCLCGHKHIHWQFAIRFDAPDATTALAKITTGLVRTEAVTLKYVGSKCITDWLDAVPESAAKLEALKRWDVEMKKMKKAMIAKVVADLCAEAGYDTPQDAYDAYISASWKAKSKLHYTDRKQLKRNAYKVKKQTLSRGTLKTWLANLATLVANQAALDAAAQAEPKTTTETTTPKQEKKIMTVLEQADEVFAAGLHENLSAKARSAFLDIRKKGKKYGLSGPQENYLAKLVGWSQPKPKKAVKPEPVAAAAASESFVSPSGIEGARY